MKKLLHLFLVSIAILTSSLQASAQSLGDKTTVGREFWLAYLQNWTTSNQYLYISGEPNTDIEISQPSYGKRPWHGKFKLNNQGIFFLDLTSFQSDVLHTETERSGKGIKITASSDVSVYVANTGSVSSDAAIILPTESLGREYYVLTYISRNTSGSSQFGIVAVEDDTEVEIVSTAQDTRGWLLPGSPKKFTLSRAGEAIQFKASDGGGVDFSGTRVRTLSGSSKNCKKIAVFGSANFTMICEDTESNTSVQEKGKKNTVSDDPGCGGGRDHQIEQCHPVESWGKTFITVPYLRRAFDIYRVLASEDSTFFYVDDLGMTKPFRNRKGDIIRLDKGDWYTFMLPNVGSDRKPKGSVIKSNRPIALGHYASSKLATRANPEQYGDPFFIWESPTEQFLKKVSFNVFVGVGSGFVYYLNVFTPTTSVGRVKFDGKPIPADQFFKIQNAPEFSFWRLENITPGNHELESPDGFVGYVYGYSRDFESYGYMTGAKLNPINLKESFVDFKSGTELKDEFDQRGNLIREAKSKICTGMDVQYIMSDISTRFRYFQWRFPDRPGRDALYDLYIKPASAEIRGRALNKEAIENYDGDTVRHTFPKPGIYYIKVFAFRDSLDFIDIDNPNKCNKPFEYEIVLDLQQEGWKGLTLEGLRRVCPGFESAVYKIRNNNNSAYPFYKWEVTGGEIVKYDTVKNEITVNWTSDPKFFNRPHPETWSSPDYDKTRVGVFVQGLDSFGCISKPAIRGINISPTPPPPFATGPACASFGKPTIYSIDSASSGASYAWRIEPQDGNFTFRFLEADSSRIEVIWSEAAANKQYRFWVREYLPKCGLSNWSPEPFTATVFPDLSKALSASLLTYPDPNRSEEAEVTLQYALDPSFSDYVVHDSMSVRRRTLLVDGSQIGDDLILERSSQTSSPYTLKDSKDIKPNSDIYEYTVLGNDNCGRPMSSTPLRTVLLEGRKREEGNEPDLKEFSILNWSPYVGWNGTVQYQVHRSLNNSPYQPYPAQGVFSNSGVEFENGDDGVFQRYAVEIRLLDSAGRYVRSAWSNRTLIAFPKTIYGTIMMTPNGDGKNDVLVIVNMEAHPVLGPKKLVVYNRWGQVIRTFDDYKQNWDGTAENSEKLEGTFYYVLLDVEGGLVTKGAVTIVR
jgi:gliding motility-associated-like protein